MIWIVGVGWLLGIFFGFDLLNYSASPEEIRRKETPTRRWRMEGLRNLVFLAIILVAVFISKPLILLLYAGTTAGLVAA